MAETWPESLIPSGMEWGLVSNDRTHTSPLSNSQQIIEMPGSFWRCSLRFDYMSREQEREMTALIGRMRGRAGTVDVPAWTRIRVDDIGEPVVVNATVYSYQITASGMTPSTSVFSSGDYITIGGEMFEVIDDVSSAANGQAVIPVNKRIRATLAPGTTIEYRRPYCRMRKTDNKYSMTVRAITAGTSFEMREAF